MKVYLTGSDLTPAEPGHHPEAGPRGPSARSEAPCYAAAVRSLAFDVGLKRTGVAVSDASGTLARPFRVLHGRDVIDAAVALVREFEEDGVELVVVGLPRRLAGGDTHATAAARAFAEALAQRTGVPVVMEDERLTSVEAEARLAELEPDWRTRKKKLDAAAAAVLLQDVLDRRARVAPDASARQERGA